MRAELPEDSTMRQVALGRAITNEREALRLTQRELADLSRVHFTSLCKIEAGINNVSLETLNRISRALKFKTWELLEKAKL